MTREELAQIRIDAAVMVRAEQFGCTLTLADKQRQALLDEVDRLMRVDRLRVAVLEQTERDRDKAREALQSLKGHRYEVKA